ncbi:MAG: hypothetical protein R3E73_13470 [Porticoccaceae bacterium]
MEEYLQQTIDNSPLPSERLLNEPAYKPAMATLQIDGGKNKKVRAGDIHRPHSPATVESMASTWENI